MRVSPRRAMGETPSSAALRPLGVRARTKHARLPRQTRNRREENVMSNLVEKLSAAQRVTCAIEAALARGVRPWIKPWSSEASAQLLELPRRANGEFYRGVNV